MKILRFKTIAGRTFKVQFNEDDFLEYFICCGIYLEIENSIMLFLNNIHQDLFDVPFDSVSFLDYEISELFSTRYNLVNDSLKFNI
jgi:hypothetical protein